MKYRVYFIEFRFYLDQIFDTYEQALEKAKTTGLAFKIREYDR